jgi:hypothetical protein
MVEIIKIAPSDQTIAALGVLQGSLEILQIDPLSGSLTLLSGKSVVRVSVKWDEIVAKLECFSISAEVLSKPSSLDTIRSVSVHGSIQAWDHVECMMRFKWVRPAHRGEVPVDWEQAVQEEGKRVDVPLSATAIGVSVVGFAFVSNDDGKAVAVVVSDDENNPGELRLIYDREEISREIESSDRVDSNRVGAWFAEAIA